MECERLVGVLIRKSHLFIHPMRDSYDRLYTLSWVTDANELAGDPDSIDEFFELYQDPTNFPDPDELEDPDFIRDRIASSNNNPHTHLLIFKLRNADGKPRVIAGGIIEFYPDSCCILVTYLFVHEAFRGFKLPGQHQNIAEIMIHSEQGLVGLVRHLTKKYGKEVKAVFFESNNPYQTDSASDSMPPEMRLRFFKRNGGKKVDFEYIQPPLDDDKGIVTNMYLLCFPGISGLSDKMPIGVVMGFLIELSKSLDQNKPPGSPACYGLERYQRDREVISNLNASNLDLIALEGFVVQGVNVIQTMYQSLLDRRVDGEKVALIAIPGAA